MWTIFKVTYNYNAGEMLETLIAQYSEEKIKILWKELKLSGYGDFFLHDSVGNIIETIYDRRLQNAK